MYLTQGAIKALVMLIRYIFDTFQSIFLIGSYWQKSISFHLKT